MSLFLIDGCTRANVSPEVCGASQKLSMLRDSEAYQGYQSYRNIIM